MKKIEAYIRPEKLEDIKDLLKTFDLNGLSISQIVGCGSQKGWKEYVRGVEVDYNFLPKLKLEIVIPDDQTEPLIALICEKARTGEVGDGKIFISDIENAVRIRTGESGLDALK
ncbi:MAG: P-II family nitrogen regulator [Anaerofustis sp.]|jgi:nitrogen regulatory protein P-II 1